MTPLELFSVIFTAVFFAIFMALIFVYGIILATNDEFRERHMGQPGRIWPLAMAAFPLLLAAATYAYL